MGAMVVCEDLSRVDRRYRLERVTAVGESRVETSRCAPRRRAEHRQPRSTRRALHHR